MSKSLIQVNFLRMPPRRSHTSKKKKQLKYNSYIDKSEFINKTFVSIPIKVNKTDTSFATFVEMMPLPLQNKNDMNLYRDKYAKWRLLSIKGIFNPIFNAYRTEKKKSTLYTALNYNKRSNGTSFNTYNMLRKHERFINITPKYLAKTVKEYQCTIIGNVVLEYTVQYKEIAINGIDIMDISQYEFFGDSEMMLENNLIIIYKKDKTPDIAVIEDQSKLLKDNERNNH
ncbi:17198_t:CDS:2 [Cetraspora pellucida]|uniref:17198_t:CDS:1 n=1 Tax=Cetraspora pellucida TaxID=1433469 RepID=A0ACA9M5X6_9GLOM|nr:17198_t:CDS:2 [Cetraspora pellucida]